MPESKQTVAFIPARGGSRGLPGKNIKPMCGKPLIVWSIEQALACNRVDEVYVSTDDECIANIASDSGALTPFLRPAEISGDIATTESAMLHFAEYLSSQGIDYENILLLQATSPVRRKGVLDRAIDDFELSCSQSMLSVSCSHRFFWKKHPAVEAFYDYKNRPRRQDIAEQDRRYLETGSFYLSKLAAVKKEGNRLSGSIELFETSEEESFEIDNAMDFRICEMIMEQLMKEGSL